MSERENFDEYIRDEFRDYSPDVSPYIWERIVAKREKKKPVGFWINLYDNKGMLLIVGIILTLATGGGLFIFHSSTLRSNKGKKNLPVITAVSNDRVTGNNLYKVGQANNNERNNLAIKQIQFSKNNTDKIIEKNLDVYKVNSSNLTAQNNQSGSAKKKQSILQFGNTYASVQIEQFNTANLETISSIKKNHSNSKGLFVNGTSSVDQNNSTEISNSTLNNYKKKYIQNRFLAGVEKLPLAKIADNNSLNQKKSPAINLPECPTIEKDAAANKRYIEMYIGPDYGIRTLTDTSNTAYLEKRKASSSFTSGFSAGVRYTKVFGNSMSVRGALNYSQINERFSFVQASVVQTTYTIDPNTGDTTGSYTVRGTRYLTTYNHYRSIDIPITIGYELGNGKFHANINAGLITNIYSWQKGDVLDTNYQPVDITTGKGSSYYEFKTNVGLGLTGGVSFYYKLTDQLHLLAEPYFRYDFQPMSTNNLSLQQKYTTIGLHVGLRFDLP